MISRPRHLFAVLTALAALVLIGLGGMVTSKEAGLAVPDWPNSFGYNMFFLPISKWKIGGIFYEHTHRLFASGVGLLTTILALWLYGKKSRALLRWGGISLIILAATSGLLLPQRWRDAVVLATTGLVACGTSCVWPACDPSPKWVRRLGLGAFFAVVLQGVLGGLRVVLLKDQIGIFHAALAQLFFVLLCSIALFTSKWFQASRITHLSAVALAKADHASRITFPPKAFGVHIPQAARLPLLCTVLIFAQLILGAMMRHQHAGLAIPDFPLAYGKIWPAMDTDSVGSYNSQRMETTAINPITAAQIALQMAHRAMAALVLVAVSACAWTTPRRIGSSHPARRLAWVWLGLLLFQAILGAATIWSNKAADIATAHVVTGAVSLAIGAVISILSITAVPRAESARSVEPVTPAGQPIPAT